MDPSNLADWVQYGAAGLVVIALIFGWLVPGRTHDQLRADRDRERDEHKAERDRLEEENRRLHESVEEKVIPLVRDAMAALERHASRDRG